MQGIIDTLFDLKGRVALVTGGGSGLGREFCDILAEFGADVVCADVYLERAEETCEIIKKYGHKILAMEADVSVYDQVINMFYNLEKSWGKLDILVNNAGVTTYRHKLHQIDTLEWEKVMNINLNGAFYCMKEGLRIMIKNNKGSIINITSIAGLSGYGGGSNIAYATSKAGLVALTRRAAAEYGAHGIRVNGIAPGFFSWTRLSESRAHKRSEEEKTKARAGLMQPPAKNALNRTGRPEDIKSLLLYLASDAAAYITGQIIVADGGSIL